MKIRFCFLISFLLISSCKVSNQLLNNKERKVVFSFIKNNINLSKKERNYIKKDDSLLYELNKSIKGNVVEKLLNKRLDSFFSKQYTKKELYVSLEVDRGFPNGEYIFELDRNRKAKKYKNVNSGEEAKLYIESIEKDMTNAIKQVQDSL